MSHKSDKTFQSLLAAAIVFVFMIGLVVSLRGCNVASVRDPWERIEYVDNDALDLEENESLDAADKLLGTARSAKWRAVREAHLVEHPECIACGSTERLAVHHIVPFHIDPKRELDPTNLATFCYDHHFGIAHLGDWKKYNKNAVRDAKAYRARMEHSK